MNILNKLTIKHLTMNKKRTIVTIIGIILSTALMVGIGLLLSTFREAMIDDIKGYNGSYNAKIENVDNSKIKLIENNTNVDEYIYRSYIGYSTINDDTTDYYKLYSIDKNYEKTLKLLSGNIPTKDDEIVVPNYLNSRYDLNLKLGDEITLNLGDRYVNDSKVTELGYLNDNEYIKIDHTKTYKIVGFIDKDVYESYEPGCYIYTKDDSINLSEVFITYKNPTKTYKVTGSIASSLGIEPYDKANNTYKGVEYNDPLLSMYGVSKYDNMIGSMVSMFSIILVLVSIACIIVIYNSFAISVMERKKQFGLFSSIGATKKQIRKTVLFEAEVVSLIGIPLGILSAYLGIGIVILIMNSLLTEALSLKLTLCTYPLFVIIPVIFMIITIFISAFLPAHKASKISPIEAIRLNDDIKIKGKKVKAPKIVGKLFGIEGELAYKNMKRNKKKYRITVVSLIISIVLFISFSGYVTYMLYGTTEFLEQPDYDIILTYNKDANMNTIKEIVNDPAVKDYTAYKYINFETNTSLKDIYTDRMKDHSKNNDYEDTLLDFIVLEDEMYNEYLKSIGESKAKPILYSKFSDIDYSSNSRKLVTFNKYKDKTAPINVINRIYDEDDPDYGEEDYKGIVENISTISDYYISNKDYFGFDNMAILDPVIIMNKSLAEEYKIYTEDSHTYMFISAPNYKKLDEFIKTSKDNGDLGEAPYYYNYKEEMKMINNLLLAIKILVYGFITLVTLIGVTSVFNTINTSIALRRKEFAVLRSIGLTPHGFTKTLCFESLFFGLKSLLFGIPISLVVVFLMYLSMSGMVEMTHVMIPWMSILFSIIGVFIVISISMMYATKKIKNENILDAIREENI